MVNSDKEKTSIEGILLMLDDMTPHVAVPVQVIKDREVIATALSDGRGRYQFVNLKPGEYQLRCQVLGGYVYYGEEKARRPENGTATGKSIILRTEQDKTLEDVNFRFAPFKRGTWRNYSYLDGLTSDMVPAIHFSPDGMIWFGTHAGVFRYDGREFVSLTMRDGLVHNFVWTIHRDPDGIMWFGTHGGVSRYDGRGFLNFTMRDGLAHNYVWTIHRDPDGTMWFGTRGGVSRYDGKRFANLTTEDGLVHDDVLAIYRDPDDIMWFGTMGGISRYDGKEFVNFTTESGLGHDGVFAIHRDTDGTMWFATGSYSWRDKGGGVTRYDGKEFVNLTTEDGLVHNGVATIHHDADGIMWFGTAWGGISRYDGNTFVNFTMEDGLVGDWVNAIHRDSDGAVWFGVVGVGGTGGVSCYDGKGVVNFSKKDGLAHEFINAIHRDTDGVMWFGTSDGVSRYDGTEFVNFTREDGLAGNRVNVMHCDSNGTMWFGTDGGISRYDGKKFVTFTTEDGLPHSNVIDIHRDPDGTMWFGTWGGVSCYDGKEFVNLTTEDGLAYKAVNAIYRDPNGAMWFATGDWWGGGGISRYDGKEFANFTTEDGLAHNSVFAIHCDPDGTMWFGTWGGGVSRYDGKQFVTFTTEDGLAHNYVNAIHRDPGGTLWFGTNGGVSGFDGIAWTSLDTRDGLAGHYVTSILQEPDGSLWFGTERGTTRYRPSTMPPEALIISITTDRTYSDISAIPAFTPNTRVTIEYNSIDFRTISDKRQYRCRIKEIDSDWHKPTKATLFDHTFGQPARYTFEVQAIDRDLNYSEPASVKLEVIPDPKNHRIIQLEEHIRQQELAELERVHRELEDARQIQLSLLPKEPPQVEGYEIAGISVPAREVSGDFYTYLLLGDNTGIVLADVTGKSVKAAMVAALASGTLNAGIRDQTDVWNSPSSILRQLNIDLQPHLIRGMYTAMSLSIIQPVERQLTLSNAGMPYPIVKRGSEVWELEVAGMPLGLIEKAEYEDLTIDLEAGDFVIFCSDGVIEAENEAGDMYQTERLLKVVQQADPDLSAQGMVDLIVQDVTEFAGGEEASDDITIVILQSKE